MTWVETGIKFDPTAVYVVSIEFSALQRLRELFDVRLPRKPRVNEGRTREDMA